MNADPIFTAVEQLREAGDDGPRRRKLLDALFRQVHNLKANASANGLTALAAAAHEFENVLHSMRSGAIDTLVSNSIPADVWQSLKQDQKYALQQSLAEGARLFVVDANFDVGRFDQEFRNLKETLSKSGDVISTSPSLINASPGNVNFRILYAQKGDVALINTAEVTVAEISLPPAPDLTKAAPDFQALERSFEKLSAELTNLPLDSAQDALQQVVRAGQAAALVTGKEVDFEVRGEELLLDKRFVAPLVHLVRNAVAHGIEASDERAKCGKTFPGKILIEVRKLEGQIRITVKDDGRGIDPSVLQQIFRAGFSTAPEISEISGRGVGLDAVKTEIEEAGGSISVSSELGQGSTFELTLPLNYFHQ